MSSEIKRLTDRPTEYIAMQFDGTNHEEITEQMNIRIYAIHASGGTHFRVPHAEGTMMTDEGAVLSEGDWIVKKVYPMEFNIKNATKVLSDQPNAFYNYAPLNTEG